MLSTSDILSLLGLNKLDLFGKSTIDENSSSDTTTIIEPYAYSDERVDIQDSDGEQSKSTDLAAKPPADFLENKQLKKLLSDLKCLAGLQRYLLNLLNLLIQGIEQAILPAHIEQMLRFIRKMLSDLTQSRASLVSKKNSPLLDLELEQWMSEVCRQQVGIELLIREHGGLENIFNKQPNSAPHSPATVHVPQDQEVPLQNSSPRLAPGPFQVN